MENKTNISEKEKINNFLNKKIIDYPKHSYDILDNISIKAEKEFGNDVYLVNKDGSECESVREQFNHPGDIPACNSENSCEVIQDFLEESTTVHWSLWYFEFKEEKERRIKEIEKRLFDIRDEHIQLTRELNIIQADIVDRLNQSLKLWQ